MEEPVMNLIPTCYYNKPLLNLIDSLVEEGYSSYSSLSVADRDKVTVQCMETLGDDAYFCMLDSDKVIPNLKKFILSCNEEDAISLAKTLRKSADSYFNDVMAWLFEERVNKRISSIHYDHGLFQSMDKNTGEIEWRRTA